MLTHITILSEDTFPSFVSVYEDSFPEDERRAVGDIADKLCDPTHPLQMYAITEEDGQVGFITYWDLGEYIYVEHFAVDERVRGCGLGSRALDEFIDKASKPIVLEAEPDDTSIASRRLRFYSRHGFTIASRTYIQPPYRAGLNAVPLFILVYGELQLDIAKVEKQLKEVVYQHFE